MENLLVKMKKKNNIFVFIVLIIALLLPVFTKSNYVISILCNCLAMASMGVAWNLIGGYGAQVSWCHAAFISIGAYTSFIFDDNFGISPLISMFIGAAIAYILATIIGLTSFRLRGPFFSISTIAFAEIVRILLLYFKGITKGAKGYALRYTGNNPLMLMFSSDKPYYYILLVLLSLMLIISYLYSKSKSGYYLNAIKGDEDAAVSLGIDSMKVKIGAFQLSAALTAIIGTVYGYFITFLDPDSVAGLDMSVNIGISAIIGGLGTLWGPVIGAVVLILLTEISNVIFGSLGGGTDLMYGLVMIIMVIYRPKGLISFFSSFKTRKRSKKIKIHTHIDD